jgi:hypothetical protein
MPAMYAAIIVQWVLAAFIAECLCRFLGISPMLALQRAVARRRSLSPTERERLFSLENARADLAIAAAEDGTESVAASVDDGGDDGNTYEEVLFEDIRPGDYLIQSDAKLFVCAAPVKRGRSSMTLIVESDGRHVEIVGRCGQAWAVQRAEAA